MDRIFLEDTTTVGVYRVAAVDKHRIFAAENPGTLATVFECSLVNPDRKSDAQIFYAMSPSIDGDNIFVDLRDSHRTHRLNTWSINIKDADIANLFSAVKPLDRPSRLELYAKHHDVAPSETVTSTSISLMSLVAFAEQQSWKTGILQRCIDRLVLPQYRNKPEVYAIIDEEYRRIIRFMYETDVNGLKDPSLSIFITKFRRLIEVLGLKHSRDTTVFPKIPDAIFDHLGFISGPNMVPIIQDNGSVKDSLSHLLYLWCGSRIVECEGGYKLEIDVNVTEGLSYMQPLLMRPKKLSILEAPM